jgi:uncharacterized SAM-binding protein YcdF (DUF218 family)
MTSLQSLPPQNPLPKATPHVDTDARLVYSYHRVGHQVLTQPPPAPSPADISDSSASTDGKCFAFDAIFCLCSLDVRVAVRAAELYLSGVAPLLIFSGGVGALTLGKYAASEADAFAAIARRMGVPDEAMLVEGRSGNTGENVRFTYALLQERERSGVGPMPRSLVLVQKPYMERRTLATFVKQWPGNQGLAEGEEGTTRFAVTSPQYEYDEYFDAENPKELVISIMVGDLVRIKEYPAKGFQIEQEIPDGVWEAGQRLIKAGYDRHLP